MREVGLFPLTFSLGKCVCLEGGGRVRRIRCWLSGGAGVILLGTGVEHPPQQKSVLEWGAVGGLRHPFLELGGILLMGRLPRALGDSGPTSSGKVLEPRRVSLSVALKFPLKCFFLFFKEKNIPKLENKGNPLPPNHTKLTLGAWRESMETRKPAVNPVRR